MARVSVIIVSYNSGAERLRRALQSLAAQEWRDFEIILVDNASTDGCIDDLPETENLTLIRNTDNLGFTGGVNCGARAAGGTWLALFNPDAVAEPGWLAALMRATEKYPETKAFGSVQLNADNPDILDGLGDVYHATGVAWRGGFGQPVALLPEGDREVFAPCAAACLYEKATFDQLGGLAEEFFCYHEDVDFGCRLRLAGGRAILVRDAVVHHEGSGTTGRYSDFTVYHGTRNRIWTFIRVMPGPLLWLLLPVHLAINLAFLVLRLVTGQGPAYFRGMKDGFFNAGPAWQRRREIQRSKRDDSTFGSMLAWSPLKLLGRRPDMRRINPSAE